MHCKSSKDLSKYLDADKFENISSFKMGESPIRKVHEKLYKDASEREKSSK